MAINVEQIMEMKKELEAIKKELEIEKLKEENEKLKKENGEMRALLFKVAVELNFEEFKKVRKEYVESYDWVGDLQSDED